MENQDPIKQLIGAFSRLPGIGSRSATRLTFHILNQPPELADSLARALLRVKETVRMCANCCNLTQGELCSICMAGRRDSSIICVVQSPTDLRAIEETAEYHGLYHVLHGLLSPLDGIGPEDLQLAPLIRRLQRSQKEGETAVTEIILAMSPSVDGEATALYISHLIRPLGIRVTRIATGVPIGGELEYVDRATLTRALNNRSTL